MSQDPREPNAEPLLEPEDVNSAPQAQSATPDPNDEIPVPIAMFPAEVDERAQVVETLREREKNEKADASDGEPRANGG